MAKRNLQNISLQFAAFRKDTEHQNRKPQLPGLPRSIEERPIVYDDGHLEEIREIAALPPKLLSQGIHCQNLTHRDMYNPLTENRF